MAIGGRWSVRVTGDAGARLEKAARECEGAIMATVNEAAAVVQREAQQNVGTKLHKTKGTGQLRRSITVLSDRGDLSAEIGSGLIYARIHEFGGVIRPVKGRYLAIPVGRLKGSPRQYDLTCVRSRKGNLVLLDAEGRTQYVLRPEVTMPERSYLRAALDAKENDIARMFGRLTQRLGLE